MRVGEIMSSPAVCVPPDRPLKEVAKVLAGRGISAVPVVDRGELAPDPRAHLAPPPATPAAARIASEAMTRDVVALPGDADVADAGGSPCPYRVTVRDGVVGIAGPPDPVDRRLVMLARGVPGVLDVRLDEE